jgi:hypothetical protein
MGTKRVIGKVMSKRSPTNQFAFLFVFGTVDFAAERDAD